MTVIAVAADAAHVAIAADREWTDSTDLRFSRTKLNPILVAGEQIGALATSGDARIGYLLEERVVAAIRSVSGDDYLAAIQGAVDAFREEHRSLVPSAEHDGCQAEALLVVRGQGFLIDDGWQVYRLAWDPGEIGAHAIGCGGRVAAGVLWYASELDEDAESRVFDACVTACELVAGCREPIDTFSMTRAD